MIKDVSYASLLTILVLGLAVVFPLLLHAEPLILSLPLDCSPLKNCFIQNYVDVDSTTAAHDYTCHNASYDGHKGVDFRISSILEMMEGVPVLAAAPGKVRAVRDGMDDKLIKSQEDYATVKDRECGNGLLVSHDDGWETQYCHMRKGSLTVQSGDTIKRGQRLGLIGLSGKTTFPHIHLAIKHNGKVIDPFSGLTPRENICESTDTPLWESFVINSFPYESGQPFLLGFADQPVSESILMERGKMVTPTSREARALVFYGMALNLEKGDRLHLQLSGPEGELAEQITKPFSRHKASYMLYTGKKRRPKPWPAGMYQGSFSLLRGDQVVWIKQESLELK